VKPLLKACLHNVGVVAVSFAIALVGRGLDALVGLPAFGFAATNDTAPSIASVSLIAAVLLVAGLLLLLAGFLLRVWATYHFYEHRMRVIRLAPQNTLLTTGPYRWTRNPLYLGGNVFIFLGAALTLGTPSGILLTALGLIPTRFMILREERQLEERFGEEWRRYKSRVRRWV
jgi:protein-S-isoprenylcysteine O-methyltransferase Ste14